MGHWDYRQYFLTDLCTFLFMCVTVKQKFLKSGFSKILADVPERRVRQNIMLL
jgi:hypothetical protein